MSSGQVTVKDLSHVLVGEDPGNIDRLWQKMLTSLMGHGMTGTVGGGVMTGIEMALWDIKGKAPWASRCGTCSAAASVTASRSMGTRGPRRAPMNCWGSVIPR